MEAQFQEPWWDKAKLQVNCSSSCACLGLIPLKVLHRMHLNKVKLAKCFRGTGETCHRCASVQSDLTHTSWSGSKLTGVWKHFFQIRSEVLETDIVPCSLVAMLGVLLFYPELTKQIKFIFYFKFTLLFSFSIASRCILLHWKSHFWHTDLMSFLKLEKIKFSLRGSTEVLHHMAAFLLIFWSYMYIYCSNHSGKHISILPNSSCDTVRRH